MTHAIKFNNEIQFVNLPDSFGEVSYGYANRTDLHGTDGFYLIVKPPLNKGEMYLPLELSDFNDETFEAVYRVTSIPAKTAEELQAEALQLETQRYIQRTQDGINTYAALSAEFRLAKLNGILSEENQKTIEAALIPVRNEVLAGQWISGLQLLEELGNSIIGEDLYNRLHTLITNYIAQNYES